MQNQSNQNKSKNVTITAFVANEKFGEGSALSVPLDAKAYDAIQSLNIGDKLLFKKSKSQAKNGQDLFFLEIPTFGDTPRGKAPAPSKKPAPRRNTEEDDV